MIVTVQCRAVCTVASRFLYKIVDDGLIPGVRMQDGDAWVDVRIILGCLDARGQWLSSHIYSDPCLILITRYRPAVQQGLNTLRPRQNGRHFADAIFKCIFLNENVWIPIKVSLEFVSQGPINNIPALVQVMAWRRSGDKPLSEPMMIRLPT